MPEKYYVSENYMSTVWTNAKMIISGVLAFQQALSKRNKKRNKKKKYKKV